MRISSRSLATKLAEALRPGGEQRYAASASNSVDPTARPSGGGIVSEVYCQRIRYAYLVSRASDQMIRRRQRESQAVDFGRMSFDLLRRTLL